MLNQPTNVIPSMLSGVGEGVIDATSPLTVSWNVSGDTPMVAYQIVIQQNDTSSTQKFSTGKVVLPSPFYGTNQLGVQQTFSAAPITAAQLSTAGIVNGYANGYKILITQWWGSTTEQSITQTSPSKFITRKTPTISINSIPNPYTERMITATGQFTQAQGDSVAFARWILVDMDDEENPIVDTGNVGTSVLQFDYDGLFSGTTYGIRLIVQSSNGVVADTGFVTFLTSYTIAEDVGVVRACKPIGQPFVELTWTSRSTIDGTKVGSVSVSDGTLDLGDNSSITYTGFFFSAPWSFAWRGQLGENPSTKVVELKSGANSYSLTVSTNGVTFSSGNDIIFTENFSILSVDTIVVVITPNAYYIKQVTFQGGTIPSPTLYPSTTLYPSEVSQKINNFNGAVSYSQQTITDIVFNGTQKCEYAWLENGTFTDLSISQMIGSVYFEPVFDSTTYFLSTFSNNDTKAVISGGGGDLIGVSIYRKESSQNALQHVVDVTDGWTIARDYGAKSRTEYQYYIFELGDTTYTSTYGSATITPVYEQFSLMECLYDETDGAYHVQAEYPFYCNVNQGSISNNNSPTKLTNFTQYATRQPVSTNYKSGTLSALIGTVNQSEATYSDSWNLADEIIGLSTNGNPKFLRDMKGAIWRVETESAIATEINGQSAFLPIKITIPWMEVGSADGLSVVAVPDDPVFTKDQIYETTLVINTDTGALMWTTPNNYIGTMLSIKNGDLVATTLDTVVPAELTINSKKFLTASI